MSNVWLRALEPEDYITTHKWRLDNDFWSGTGGTKKFISIDTERRWLLNAIENHEKGNVFRFVVCVDENKTPAGLITASSVDYINKSCEISTIIAPEYRGKGVSHPAKIKVFGYLFNQIGMNRIEGRVLIDNMASRRSVEKFGSIEEGILKEAIYKDGKYKDVVFYAMLKKDFILRYGDKTDY